MLTKIYRCISGSTCSEARAQKWRQQKKKNTLNLPPDSDSLYHHLQRANYLTYCLQNFDHKEHPSPIGNGWNLENGKCRAVRYRHRPLPKCYYETDNDVESLSNESEDSDIDNDTEYDSFTDSSTDSDSSDIICAAA